MTKKQSRMKLLNQYTSRTVPGGVGGLLAITDASQGSHFCAYDGNGNVMALLKADGSGLTAQYEYGPFGEVLRATGAMAKTNPFRFSTKYQDEESDFLYYGYRYYNPSTGRWPNSDPIGERGGANLFAFVANNPINKLDRLGLIGDPGPDPFDANLRRKRCMACKCKSVRVTFSPGGDQFKWAWRAPSVENATDRYGNDMIVSWKVEGNPRGCEFHQDERGEPNYFKAGREWPPASKERASGKDNILTDNHPISAYGDGSFTYIDSFGVNFRPGDEGQWDIVMDFKPVLKCVSSDGTSMSVTVPLKGHSTITYPK